MVSVKRLYDEDLVNKNRSGAYDAIKSISQFQVSYQATSREVCLPLAACLCTLLVSNFPVPLLQQNTVKTSDISNGIFNSDLFKDEIDAGNEASLNSEKNILKNPIYAIFEVLCQTNPDGLSLRCSNISYRLIFGVFKLMFSVVT